GPGAGCVAPPSVQPGVCHPPGVAGRVRRAVVGRGAGARGRAGVRWEAGGLAVRGSGRSGPVRAGAGGRRTGAAPPLRWGCAGRARGEEVRVARFSRSDDLRGATFEGADLRGARFVDADLAGVVMRGVQVEGMDVDAPWLPDGDVPLRVNGVDVVGFVEAELDRRFPGRELRRAADPEGLRAAWAALESTCRSTASGRSRRRCGTWCSRRTRGWGARSWGWSTRSTRSGGRAPGRRPRAWTCGGSSGARPRPATCATRGRPG